MNLRKRPRLILNDNMIESETTLLVNETFLSIQGESTYAGLPCFFIRLAGCNLNCAYCDTAYARSSDDGQELSIKTLCNTAVDSGCRLVLITGGEPLLQSGVPELCRCLLAEGFRVLIETNGSVSLKGFPEQVVKIMDIKGLSSGEANKFLPVNLEYLNERDEIKFIIADRNDFDYAVKMIDTHKLDKITGNILFSPAFGSIEPKTLASWIIEDLPPVRMQLQLHKYIWSPELRGV